MTNLPSFAIGARVECHPSTDSWMMGDRYGIVQKSTFPRSKTSLHHYERVHVLMDISGKVKKFLPADLEQI